MTCCAVSPDGTLLATAGDDVVKVWDLGANSQARTLTGHTYAHVTEGCRDDLRFAEALRVGSCPKWMVKAMSLESADPARVPDPVDGFTFEPEGPFLSPGEGRLSLDVGVSRSLTRTPLERGGNGCVHTVASYEDLLESHGISFVDVHVLG